MAIPTSAINRQRVYMAFNFEAHYGLASSDTFLTSLRMPVFLNWTLIIVVKLWIKVYFSFYHQFIGNDLTQKRDIHGAMVDDRLKHFADSKNVYTRKNFYRIIEQQINSYGDFYIILKKRQIPICLTSFRYGYNGTSCLLRTICETAETPFYEYNGVFGNIFHILFT